MNVSDRPVALTPRTSSRTPSHRDSPSIPFVSSTPSDHVQTKAISPLRARRLHSSALASGKGSARSARRGKDRSRDSIILVVGSAATCGILQVLACATEEAQMAEDHTMISLAGSSRSAQTGGDSESIMSASSGSSQTTTPAAHLAGSTSREQTLYPAANASSQSTETLRSGGVPKAVSTQHGDANKEFKDSAVCPSDTNACIIEGPLGSPKHLRTLSSPSASLVSNESATASSRSRHVSWHPEPPQALATSSDVRHPLVDIVALGASLEPVLQGQDDSTSTSTTWGSNGRVPSEISRTPSQSTTGTSKTLSSLETAASSLQSGSCPSDGKHDESACTETAYPAQNAKGQAMTASNSQDNNTTEKRDMNALRRYYALLELVQSECEYVEDLDILVNVFFQNLEQQPYFEGSPARVAIVRRNASELLDVHKTLATNVLKVVDECMVNPEAEGSEMEKAQLSDEAVIRVSQVLANSAADLDIYHTFCSMQAEADQVLSEARSRHNGTDFAAYERTCSNLLRSTSRAVTPRSASTSRRASLSTTSVAFPGLTQLTNDNDVSDVPTSPTLPTSPLTTAPPSGATTPSGSVASFGASSTIRQSQLLRLRFNDYHIKPVQRLCRYSLFLNAIIQFTPVEDVITRSALHKAIDRLDDVSTAVDQASLRRQKEIVGTTLFKRLERPTELSDELIESLGAPELVGVADILHHHPTLHPLRQPFRFNRAGIVLWADFLVFVRVRKNKRLVCQSYFPLRDASIGPLYADVTAVARSPLSEGGREASPGNYGVRSSFSLTINDHVFEMSARSERERNLWYNAIALAIKGSLLSANKSLPNSFPIVQSGQRLDVATMESLQEALRAHERATAASGKDAVIKFPSASLCAHFDRLMTFSEVFRDSTPGVGFAIGTSGQAGSKDIYEMVAAQQARQTPGPSISSTVVGLAKMATTQVPNAIRSRRSSNARQLDAQMLPRIPASSATGLVSAASTEANAAEKGKSKATDDGQDDDSALSSAEGFGSRLRSTFRRQSIRLPPRKSATMPLSLGSSDFVGRNGIDTMRPIELVSPRHDLRDGVLRVDTASLAPPPGMIHSRSTSLLCADSIGSSSGADEPAHSTFTTPSEELDEAPLSVVDPLGPENSQSSSEDKEVLQVNTLLSSPTITAAHGRGPAVVTARRSSLTPSSPSSMGFSDRHESDDGNSSITASPTTSAPQLRESAARTLHRARSGAWNRMSTFGPPVVMGPASSSSASPTVTRLTRASTDFSPTAYKFSDDGGIAYAPSRDSIDQSAGSGTASCSSSIRSASSRRSSFARIRGTLARSFTVRGKSQPAPAVTSTGDLFMSDESGRDVSGLGMVSLADVPIRIHSRRASIVESPLLTDSAVKLVSETARDLPSASVPGHENASIATTSMHRAGDCIPSRTPSDD